MVDVEIDGAMTTNAQCQQWCSTAAHGSTFRAVGCCQFIRPTSTCTAFAAVEAADRRNRLQLIASGVRVHRAALCTSQPSTADPASPAAVEMVGPLRLGTSCSITENQRCEVQPAGAGLTSASCRSACITMADCHFTYFHADTGYCRLLVSCTTMVGHPGAESWAKKSSAAGATLHLNPQLNNPITNTIVESVEFTDYPAVLASAGDGQHTFVVSVLYSTNLSQSTLGTVLTIEFRPTLITGAAADAERVLPVERSELLQAHAGTVSEVFAVPNNTDLDGSPAVYELRATVVAVETMSVVSSAAAQLSVLPAMLGIAEQIDTVAAPTAAPSWHDDSLLCNGTPDPSWCNLAAPYCNQPAIYGACPVGCGTCVETTTTSTAAAITAAPTASPIVPADLGFRGQLRIGDVQIDSTAASGVDMVGGPNREHAYAMTVRQLRHHFGPFLAHLSAPLHPTRAV